MPEFRNRPEQYPAIGALGKTLQKVDEFARKPFGYDNPPAAMISDFLDIPGVYKTAENISYGSPLTRGTGLARQMTDDTKAGLMGAMNLAPGVSALAKAAKPMVKAAAPYAARHAVNVAEKYGVSPTMNIVKPEGNLNFRHSVIAEHLKGPEKQKLGDFIKQVKGMKGLTKEGKKAAMSALEAMDPNTVVTKQFIEDSFTPSKFSTVDLAGAADNAEEHLFHQAQDMVHDDPDYWDSFSSFIDVEPNPTLRVQLDKLAHIWDANRLQDVVDNLEPELKQALQKLGVMDDAGVFDGGKFADLQEEYNSLRMDETLEYLRTNYEPSEGSYQYEEYQRLNPDIRVGDYVEKGVSHPDAPSTYAHYPEASEPIVAHFRGTSNPESLYHPTEGEFTPGDNAFVIEELQSDAQKGKKQEGPLHQAHATAFKAAVQHALEQGHNKVYLPTAETIGSVRSKPAASFAPIYDQEVINHGLAPLSRVPGVKVNPIVTEGDNPITAYHEIDFSPEARDEILRGKGQAFPGFAGGGSVDLRSHYLGTPMTQVGHRIGSRAIEAESAGDEEMPEMPKNPTPEQNAEFTRRINEYFKRQADKKYWAQRGPNSADDRESRFGELTQSDDPINIEVPPKFGVTSIPLAPEPEEIEEKKSNRYYADGGTVNLRAHYLGYQHG